jgi:hypothetical protein
MVIERKLKIDLSDTISFFQGIKYKFFEILETPEKHVRIEIPHGDEILTVEIPIKGQDELESVTKKLKEAYFIEYEIRPYRTL